MINYIKFYIYFFHEDLDWAQSPNSNLTKHPSFECLKKNEINSSYKQCEYNYGEFCNKNSELFYRKIYDKSLHNWSYSFDLYCNNEHYIPLIGSSFFLVGF